MQDRVCIQNAVGINIDILGWLSMVPQPYDPSHIAHLNARDIM
jgi:hypothetical protein